MSHRIKPLLDHSRRRERAWIGEESDATVELKIEFENGISGIYVAFFRFDNFSSEMKWLHEPEHIRRFDGPGTYTINTIPEGSYILGASTEYPLANNFEIYIPYAVGVHSSWPYPVRVQGGATVKAHVLVAKAFDEALDHRGWDMRFQMDGYWAAFDPSQFLTGEVVDPDGDPVAVGHVSVRGLADEYGQIANWADLGIGPDGFYFFDKVGRDYSVVAEWNDINMFQFVCLANTHPH
jgi:hypothetical protein